MVLQLSTLVLCSVLILACAGLMRATAQRLGISEGTIAALSLLLLALSAFEFPRTGPVTVNAAFCLLLLLCGLLCRGLPEIADALLVAVCGGALGFAMYRLLPNFYELGLPVSLPAALIGSQLFGRRRTALLSVAAAPVFFSLCVMLEELYLFETASIRLGNPIALDAQLMGILLLFALWYLPRLRIRRTRTAQ